MRRHLRLWAVLLLVPLLLSAGVGRLVVSAIGPRDEESGVRFVGGTMVTGTADPTRVRYDLLSRGPTTFTNPRKPTQQEVAEFDQLMTTLAAGANNWQFNYAINGIRAAEEWGPLGAYARPDDKPTVGAIEQEATRFQQDTNRMVGPGANEKPERPFGFSSAKLISVAPASVGPERRLVARHTVTANGAESVWYTRWYVCQRTLQVGVGLPGGMLGLYDFDEPVGRLRQTARRAGESSARRKVAGPDADPTEYGTVLVNGLAAAADGDKAVVQKSAATLRDAELIPALTAGRMVLEGHAALAADNPNKALGLFNDALNKWADTPPAVLGRAIVFNRQKKPADALKAIAIYRDEVGNGPEAFLEEARAKRGLGDTAGATAALRAGLAETPDSLPLLVELAAGSPEDAGQRAAESGTAGTTLPTLVAKLENNTPVERLAALVKGFRTVRPRDPVGLYEDGLLRLRQGKSADALKLFQEGRERAGGRKELMPVLGRATALLPPADVYRAIGGADPDAAFKEVGEALFANMLMLADTDRAKAAVTDLETVVALHRTKVPADPLSDLYAAEVAVQRNDFATADRLLADGIRKLKPPPFEPADDATPTPAEKTWQRFRSRRAKVLVKLGKWATAYAELQPAEETFHQLAALLAAANDADGLLGLAAAHATAVPNDIEALAVKADGHFRKQQYEPAVTAAAAYIKQTETTAIRWEETAEIRVRGLVRLNKFADADAACEEFRQWAVAQPPTPDGPSLAYPIDRAYLLQSVVVAAEKGADELLARLAENKLAARWAALFYADPDLGPRLRSPAFAAFRERFPPPK